MLTGHVQIREFLADTRAMTTTTVLVLVAGFLSGYVLRDFTWFARSGATRRAPGITVHGLRHGYAAERYETLSGTPAPVRGGRLADREADLRARFGGRRGARAQPSADRWCPPWRSSQVGGGRRLTTGGRRRSEQFDVLSIRCQRHFFEAARSSSVVTFARQRDHRWLYSAQS
jgi:hypothetical protein